MTNDSSSGRSRSAPPAEARLLVFGVFELDLAKRELRRSGVRIKLAPKPLEALICLAAHRGEIVTRDELRRRVWGDETFVESDLAINSCMMKVRQALDDDARSARFIETLPRQGYRFVAPVETRGLRSRSRLAALTARWLVSAAVSIALAAIVVLVLVNSRADWKRPADPSRALTLIAVLAVEDLRTPVAPTHFAAGLNEALMASLARVLPSGVAILDHASSARLEQVRASPFGSRVDYLLRSSVRGDAERMKFVARLVRASDDAVVWSEEVEVDLGGELDAQDRIAAAVAVTLGSELHARETMPVAEHTRVAPQSKVPEATDAYLKGLYLLLGGNRDQLTRAVPLFQEAIDLDPSLAAAHAALARTFCRLVLAGEPSAGFARARAAAEEAIRLDPEQVDARIALGYVRLYFEHDLDGAWDVLEEAAQLAPGLARPHSALATIASIGQQHGRAVREARLARDLDPLGLSVSADLCWYLVFAGDFDGARSECERSLELEPDHQWTLLGLSEAHLGLGDTEGAATALRRAFRLPDDPELATVTAIWNFLGTALDRSGRADPFVVAAAFARAGDLPAALRKLEEAAQRNSFWLVYLRIDPRLDPLHGHAEFERLARDLGLPREAVGAGHTGL